LNTVWIGIIGFWRFWISGFGEDIFTISLFGVLDFGWIGISKFHKPITDTIDGFFICALMRYIATMADTLYLILKNLIM